jgi:cellulose synthase/poly-beta-1,6-N-acetylglucosamine synthase-like glycosyltransferase
MASLEGFLQKEIITQQKRWAIAFVFTGAMTFFFSAFVNPLFASLLIVLGITNYLINGRWVFILNSLVLTITATITLVFSIESALIANSLAILPSLGIISGLVEIGWGLQEFRKFTRFQKAS